jgi:hypothetical protein
MMMATATERVTSVTLKLFMTRMKVMFIDKNKAFDPFSNQVRGISIFCQNA